MDNNVTVYKDSHAIQNTFLNPDTWGQMRAIADTLVRSNSLPNDVRNAEQAMIKMQTGLEMGMTPMAAMQRLYIVNGSVLPWGAETVNRLRQFGYNIEYKDESDESCTAVVTKKGEESYTETFTYNLAESSGYTKTSKGKLKPGWYPGANRKLKLRYHALSMIIKTYIPEVLGGASDIADVAVDIIPDEKQEPTEKQEIKTAKSKKVEHSEEFDKKRKQFFAILQNLGADSEKAKEKLKKKYDVKSFNDLNLIQLAGAISTLRDLQSSGKVKKKKEEDGKSK